MIDRNIGATIATNLSKIKENNYKIVIIFFLGISSGIPFLLLLSTFSIWLMEEGISKTQIGLLTWVTVPYTLKFLIAPFLDKIKVVFLSDFLGQRRSWMLLSQLGLITFLIALGTTDPSYNLIPTIIFAFAVGICSACLDIVVEAYRIEILENNKLGAGASASVLGYRIGMLCSGAGAIYLASFFNSWYISYSIMALCVGLGVITTLVAPEPCKKKLYWSIKNLGKNFNANNKTLNENELSLKKECSESYPESYPESCVESCAETCAESPACFKYNVFNKFLITPLKELIRLNSIVVIVLFIVSFKVADTVLNIMTMPFLIEIGFSKIEIANVAKTFGIFAMILGGIFAGIFLGRKNLYKLLILCANFQLLASVLFIVQAYVGNNLLFLFITMGIENVTCGMGQVAIIAYLSSLCNRSHTATHYALLSSFASFVRVKFSSLSGIVADCVTWLNFYSIVALSCIPCIVILFVCKSHFERLSESKLD